LKRDRKRQGTGDKVVSGRRRIEFAREGRENRHLILMTLGI